MITQTQIDFFLGENRNYKAYFPLIGLPPQGGNWNFLPQIPEQDSSVVVPQDQLSLVTGEGNLVVAALILLSILLFLLKLRRS